MTTDFASVITSGQVKIAESTPDNAIRYVMDAMVPKLTSVSSV